jgi:cytochrome d ubiquinol oxidase subunit II
MELNTVWFLIVSFLFAGFFVLEGFDFGVGILLQFLGKTDHKRRVMINTIGPHWDGNEVWLIAAGGSIFAAFPEWYATLFSGFYLPLFLILIGLILRGVSFDFRNKVDNPAWKGVWDWCIFIGSLLPALLWGVAFANIVRGVPLDAGMRYVGGFWNLLNGYALLGGLVSLLLFTMHGAAFLSIKISGELEEKAREVVRKLWVTLLVAFGGFLISSYTAVDFMGNGWNLALGIAFLVLLVAIGWLTRQKKMGWVFVLSTVCVLLFALFFVVGLYPRVLVSSTNPAWSLDIYNAAADAYALRIMTTVAAIFIPLLLVYQGWTYWVFRKRISEKTSEDTLVY